MSPLLIQHEHGAAAQTDLAGGFVLIPVLAALFLLALSAVVLQRSVALDIKVTRLANQHAAAAQLSDGLTRLAIRHLSVTPPTAGKSGEFRLDGIPLTCRMGPRSVTISVVDTDGLVNLNRASPALLERLFAAAGASDASAKRLAENVIDFRTPGEVSQTGSSKLAPYLQTGMNHGPKSAPFDTIGELDQVAGMSPALMTAIRPLVTIHSRFATLNPRVASLPVLQAFAGPGVSLTGRPSADLIDDLRSKVTIPADFTYIPMTRSVRQTTSNTYIVSVVVDQPDGYRAGRQATVELDSAKRDASIRAWGELDAQTLARSTKGTNDPPACIGGLLRTDAALP